MFNPFTMKFIFSIVCVFIIGFSFSQSTSASADNIDSIYLRLRPDIKKRIGQPYLDFSFTSNGKTISNDMLKGKVVLINFWFEGCHPCMAEMGALNELYEKLKDNDDFKFISITRDNDEAIARVKKKFSLKFDIISTTDKECRRLIFNTGYPISIILDKTGAVKFMHFYGSIEVQKAREHVMTTVLSEIQSLL